MDFLWYWLFAGVLSAMFYGFCLNVSDSGKRMLDNKSLGFFVGLMAAIILGGFLSLLCMTIGFVAGAIKGYKMKGGSND